MKATKQNEPHSVGYTEGYRLLSIGVVHGTDFERRYCEFCREQGLECNKESIDLYFYSLKSTEQSEVID